MELSMSEIMLDMSEKLIPIRDAVDGHRAAALDRGYSPAAAEAMAVQFHAGMMTLIFNK